MQVWPWVVRITAPGGSDSKFNAWSCSDDELDDIQSGAQSGTEEHPVSETPTTAATTQATPTRDMPPPPSLPK
jgi:hypothetical protein